MPITRCPNGHFYDPSTNSSCPWCAVSTDDNVATQRVVPNIGSSEGATVRISSAPTPQRAVAAQPGMSPIEEGHTVAVVKKKSGIDPVVGWLVCTKGPDKGRDFRIRSEKNSVGRSDAMDISIPGDETISRNDHAFIVYDPKKGVFRIQAGLSRGLVYLNDEEVISSEKLKPYDTIEIGESTFKFVPFCGEAFQWERETPGEK
ncbi:MAG: FHA domain-containing protein [Synergistes jonesii]|uniref:FHA domain-containing protein n=1 Tax=Synergistes jonesii TaxID=2754 RepID=UPI002A753AA3|nr:FHA domain-containing protein [Synergistes jonesii]MDY2985669.1 FHA domain-containing protein [Synergistes jonesii]